MRLNNARSHHIHDVNALAHDQPLDRTLVCQGDHLVTGCQVLSSTRADSSLMSGAVLLLLLLLLLPPPPPPPPKPAYRPMLG